MPRIAEPAKDVVIRVPCLLSPVREPEAGQPTSSAGPPKGKSKNTDDDEEQPRYRPDLSALPSDPRQAEVAKACASAAEWNSLLIWARAQRGPQWDAGTGMWQVDKGSQEYYGFCSSPTQQELAAAVAVDDEDNGPRARTHGRAQSHAHDREGSPIVGPGHGPRSRRL